MGLRFRKSKKIGPFRLNVSKSGVGYSYGNKYARVTHTADGKKRTTYTLPGTGVSWSETESKSNRQSPPKSAEPDKEKRGSGCFTWICFVVAAILICWFAFSRNVPKETAGITQRSTLATVATEIQSQTLPISEAASDPETTAQTEVPTEATTDAVTEATMEPTTEPETTAATTEPVEEFFIANKNTKKYHHTWCSYAPDENSKNYWLTNTTRENLEKMGYEPCKRCMDSIQVVTEATASAATENTLAKAPDKYNDTFVCLADKTTKIYHNPWCEYAPELGTSNCYSGPMTAQQLEDEGYKPCAKCIW